MQRTIQIYDPTLAEAALRKDIQRDRDKGNITRGDSWDLYGEGDDDSYFPHGESSDPYRFPCTMNRYNYGSLEKMPVAAEVFPLIQGYARKMGATVEHLEIGAGLGIIPAQVHTMYGWIVDVIVGTALAPHYRPHPNIQAALRHHQSALEDVQRLNGDIPCDWPDHMLKNMRQSLRHPRPKPYTPTKTRYFRHQYVGRLPYHFTLPKKKYLSANERCGALHYVADTGLEETFLAIMHSLLENGTLVADGDRSSQLVRLAGKHFQDWTAISDSDVALIAGPTSPLAGIEDKGSVLQSVREWEPNE